MKENIKISQLRALVAVSEYSNFSEAGLQLDLSQSAISHAIASLETELGISLFHRGRHGAVITPVGSRIVCKARQILLLLDEMGREASNSRGFQGGELRVGSFRSAATHLLPPILARFQERFPDVSVSVMDHADFPQVEQDLRTGRIDLGFTHLPVGSEFETWEVLRDEYVLLLPPRIRLAASHTRLTWDQLAQYPLIMSTDSPCCDLIHRHLAEGGCEIKVAYHVKEDSTIVGMVAQGLGAGILPRLAAEPLPASIRVCSLPETLERTIGVAVKADAQHPPVVYAFLDAVRQTGVFAPASPLHGSVA